MAQRSRPPPSRFRREIPQPVAIELFRRRTPGVRDLASAAIAVGKSASSSSRRSRSARCRSAVSASTVVLVEIALRHRRIGVALAPEEAADIAAIFEQQRDRLVFRMALEEHEQALSLLHERVDARRPPTASARDSRTPAAPPRASRSTAIAASAGDAARRPSMDDPRRARIRRRRSACRRAGAERCRRGAECPRARRGTTGSSNGCGARPTRAPASGFPSTVRPRGRPPAARCRSR